MIVSLSIPEIWARLWAQRRSLIAFAILFRALESLLFAPLAGAAGQALAGRPIVDSTALVSFVLSPRGFAAVALGAIALLTIRLLEHAGLSLIVWGALDRKHVPAQSALWYVARRLPVLIQVCAGYVATGLAVASPALLTAALFAKPLLAQHDINYYLAERPAEFLRAATTTGIVALACALLGLWLAVRWRWSVQTCLFEGRAVANGFAASARLTRDVRGRIALATLTSSAFSAGLGLAASFLGGAAVTAVLSITGEGASLALLLPLLLIIRASIGSAATLAGSCFDAGLFTALYREQRERLDAGPVELPAVQRGTIKSLPRTVRWLMAASLAGVVGFAGAGIVVAAQGLRQERPITIHAHRGDSARAPENTLAAARLAAEAGADYIETDVQLSKDGVLVINHDSDFSRVGGVAAKVWDLTYDEIRAIPLGAGKDPEFRGEHIPTLDELLAASKDQIDVNIELKYYGDRQPGLSAKTVEAIRRNGMEAHVVVQCLELEPLLEVRKLAPEIPIGYLMSVNARRPKRLDVDFLSVEQRRVTGAFVAGAHRRDQRIYLWTVNKAGDMERAFDLGVDGIITDQPALAFERRGAYGELSAAERAVRRIKVWLDR